MEKVSQNQSKEKNKALPLILPNRGKNEIGENWGLTIKTSGDILDCLNLETLSHFASTSALQTEDISNLTESCEAKTLVFRSASNWDKRH